MADLIETTELIPRDRLVSARSRAGGGSLTTAIMDERLNVPVEGLEVPGLRTGPRASSNDEARELAERLHLPYVDLASSGVEKGAAEAIPVHVLERVDALP